MGIRNHDNRQKNAEVWPFLKLCNAKSVDLPHRQKLYTKIPQKGPGQRTATPNMAFQVGPYSIGIAVVDARRLLAAVVTAVPSKRGRQKVNRQMR